MPLPTRRPTLVLVEEVQRELKLTDTQKQRHAALKEQQQARMQKAREDYEDREIFLAARNAILDDWESAIQDALEPGQRERLEQIRLQVQGPLAFDQRAIRRALDLSDDQADEIEAIVDEGMKELRTTSSVVVVLDPGDNPQTLVAIRELVGGLEFPRSW